MGFVTTFTASGQGSLALGSVVAVTEVAARIITRADEAVLDGVAPVRRVHKQCWYGIGFVPGAGPLSGFFMVTWHKFMQVETEDLVASVGNIGLADTLVWDIRHGGVMYFEVDW